MIIAVGNIESRITMTTKIFGELEKIFVVSCLRREYGACAYVRGKNGLGEIDRTEHSLRCIPRTFNAFLRDLMHACVFAIPSVTRVARVRCISLARKMSLLEIVASRYSRYKLYKLDEIFTSRCFRIVPLYNGKMEPISIRGVNSIFYHSYLSLKNAHTLIYYSL